MDVLFVVSQRSGPSWVSEDERVSSSCPCLQRVPWPLSRAYYHLLEVSAVLEVPPKPFKLYVSNSRESRKPKTSFTRAEIMTKSLVWLTDKWRVKIGTNWIQTRLMVMNLQLSQLSWRIRCNMFYLFNHEAADQKLGPEPFMFLMSHLSHIYNSPTLWTSIFFLGKYLFFFFSSDYTEMWCQL